MLSKICNCGKMDLESSDKATRIVGGKEAKEDNHPWQVSLHCLLDVRSRQNQRVDRNLQIVVTEGIWVVKQTIKEAVHSERGETERKGLCK